MVPLAVGTQTNGSVIRPAAFCGVVGYKPTFGLIARDGVLRQSPALDQIGVLARSVEDAALLAAVLFDSGVVHGFLDAVHEPVVTPPRFALVKTPLWQRADADTRAAITQFVARLGDAVAERPMPETAAGAWDWQRTVMEAEIACNYDAEWTQGRDRLSVSLQSQIERGRTTTAFDYQHALAKIDAVNAAFDVLYAEYDVILTPAVPGTAPSGLDSTGDPAFCTLWTFCGMPALTLPLLKGANGLPLGLQLVAPRQGDARLLRAARWLAGAAI
jgi:Asp-tRNA(Asn)/Glu-tRNA(Gln) amidotransferase A subunit family amidase